MKNYTIIAGLRYRSNKELSMVYRLITLMLITISSCFGEDDGQLKDTETSNLQPMLAISERLFTYEPHFDCIKKLYCLQAINGQDDSNNPIKALAKLYRSNPEAFEKIKKSIKHLSHMEAAMDAIDIGDEFHSKSRCETAYPTCPVSSDDLEMFEEMILKGEAEPSIDNHSDRPKRGLNNCALAMGLSCAGTNVACGIVSFFTLGLGAGCFAGSGTLCAVGNSSC